MNKTILFAGILVMAGALVTSAESTADKPAFTIRKMEPQVVLYTIYRGSYDKMGAEIGKLFALAGQKAISPRGQALYVYLNNPKFTPAEHCLTEIRIPVAKEALQSAGTLGPMTDVKQLPAMELAVAVKPEGLAEPDCIYNDLFKWITEQGYMGADSPIEKILSNEMTGDYSKMKAEIMIPVVKVSAD